MQGRPAEDLQLVLHSLLQLVQGLVLVHHQIVLHLRQSPLQQTQLRRLRREVKQTQVSLLHLPPQLHHLLAVVQRILQVHQDYFALFQRVPADQLLRLQQKLSELLPNHGQRPQLVLDHSLGGGQNGQVELGFAPKVGIVELPRDFCQREHVLVEEILLASELSREEGNGGPKLLPHFLDVGRVAGAGLAFYVFVGVAHFAEVPADDRAGEDLSVGLLDVVGQLDCCVEGAFCEGLHDQLFDFFGLFVLSLLVEGSDQGSPFDLFGGSELPELVEDCGIAEA